MAKSSRLIKTTMLLNRHKLPSLIIMFMTSLNNEQQKINEMHLPSSTFFARVKQLSISVMIAVTLDGSGQRKTCPSLRVPRPHPCLFQRAERTKQLSVSRLDGEKNSDLGYLGRNRAPVTPPQVQGNAVGLPRRFLPINHKSSREVEDIPVSASAALVWL